MFKFVTLGLMTYKVNVKKRALVRLESADKFKYIGHTTSLLGIRPLVTNPTQKLSFDPVPVIML